MGVNGPVFNNYKATLRPGVTGKQLATGLKALGGRIGPLYDLHDLPCWFTNRLCLGAASMIWGGRPAGPDYLLSEQDFLCWGPNQSDSYSPPCDWSLETKARPSENIQTWRINAQNTAKKFPAVYGDGHLQERMAAVEDLRGMRVRAPRKFTLPFIRGDWVTLNYRWAHELKELTNTPRSYAKVESPTFDQLKVIGATINPEDGQTIFVDLTRFD